MPVPCTGARTPDDPVISETGPGKSFFLVGVVEVVRCGSSSATCSRQNPQVRLATFHRLARFVFVVTVERELIAWRERFDI